MNVTSNLYAVNSFKRAANLREPQDFLVTVWQNGKESFKKYISVVITQSPTSHETYNVNISWEESGIKNYRDKGLYGYYSTYYCEMEFNEDYNFLKIYSNNDTQISIDI